MAKVVTLILLLGLVCCARHNETTQPLHSAVDSTAAAAPSEANDFYTISKKYGDSDSDSLLAPIAIKKQIRAFKMRGTEIAQQPYGGGDCWGKIRRYVLGEDTLTIDKHNCGEYSFGNAVFIKAGDSLKQVVIYRIDHQLLTDLLEIAEFKQHRSSIRTSADTIANWSPLNLDRAPQKSDLFRDEQASQHYKYYKGLYEELKTLEQISEE